MYIFLRSKATKIRVCNKGKGEKIEIVCTRDGGGGPPIRLPAIAGGAKRELEGGGIRQSGLSTGPNSLLPRVPLISQCPPHTLAADLIQHLLLRLLLRLYNLLVLVVVVRTWLLRLRLLGGLRGKTQGLLLVLLLLELGDGGRRRGGG